MPSDYHTSDKMYCCSLCFENEELKKYIESNGHTGKCDYTNENEIKVLDTYSLGMYIRKCLGKRYEWIDEEVGNYDYEYKVYLVPILSLRDEMDKWKLISERVDKWQLIKDLFNDSIDGRAYFNDYDFLDDNDLSIVIKGSYSQGEDSRVNIEWKKFKYLSKHYNRYFDINKNYSREAYLLTVKEYLPEYENDVNIGTTFYRARSAAGVNLYSDDIESEISPAPPQYATTNRMSPSGIAYLYLSDVMTSTFAEIRVNEEESSYIVGEFRAKKNLRIIDFTKEVKFEKNVFCEEYSENDNWISDFFDNFIQELSTPIDKEKKDCSYEYIATQVLAEYIRFLGYEGIKFSSTVAEGSTYVFFCSTDCIQNEDIFEVPDKDPDFPKLPSYKKWFNIECINLIKIKNIIKEDFDIPVKREVYFPEIRDNLTFDTTEYIQKIIYNFDVIERLK